MQYVFIFIAFCMLYSLIKIKLSTCSIILIVAWKVLPCENQNKVLVKGLILIRLHAIIKKKSKVFISKIQSCNVPRITFGNTCLDANKQGIDFHNNLPINYVSIKNTCINSASSLAKETFFVACAALALAFLFASSSIQAAREITPPDTIYGVMVVDPGSRAILTCSSGTILGKYWGTDTALHGCCLNLALHAAQEEGV